MQASNSVASRPPYQFCASATYECSASLAILSVDVCFSLYRTERATKAFRQNVSLLYDIKYLYNPSLYRHE